MDRTEIERLAEIAGRLSRDEGLAEVFAAIRERQVKRFTDSAPDEADEREDAHRMLRAIAAVEQQLARFSGDLALLENKELRHERRKRPQR